ncbi:GGDEF and EAL domain-containing protein [Fundidesulfovibrio butyratiphilus]
MTRDVQLYELMCKTSPHCEFLIDQDGRLRYASDCCSLLGIEQGRPFDLEPLVRPEDRRTLSAFLASLRLSCEANWRMFSVMLPGGGACEALVCGRCIEGPDRTPWLRMSVTALDSETHRRLAWTMDTVDHLTGLANRDYLIKRMLELRHRLLANPDIAFAGVYVDIDRLKKINDAFGPAAGDAVIRKAGLRLRGLMPDQALLARLSGDEFFVLLEGLSPREVVRLVKRMIKGLAVPFELDEQEVQLSAGFGMVVSPAVLEAPEDIIRYANIAVRYAKKSQHRFKVFNTSMLERSIRRMELEIDFYRGLKNGEFSMAYQPILSLDTQALTGVEALLRWNHPKWGEVKPAEFIPLAEDTGFILPLGRWVLEQSCRDMCELIAANPQAGDFSMSVNLSLHQLHLHDIVDQVLGILKATGLDPHRLKLEITESVAMTNPDLAAERIRQLKDAGVRVCIDDFGTGYSSLSHLQSLPIDTLKVDKTFVGKMDRNPKKRKLVRSVVNLAHNLRLNVVAEGIEMREQWSMLKALDCESGQGFLFSRPLPLDDVLKFLDKKS